MSFEAYADETQVNLRWVTAIEINNDYFTIERSIDGFNFDSLFIIEGAGNSYSIIEYFEVDPNPVEGISYYRLKQTDFDGMYSYSHLRSVDFESEIKIRVFPNPAMNELTIEGIVSEESEIVLINTIGQQLHTTSIIKDNRLIINVQNIPPGLYLISVGYKILETKLLIKGN